MKRRSFFEALGCLAAIRPVSPQPRRIIQELDAADGWRARVILDGVDISADCRFYALYSDGTGEALCLDREETNRTRWATWKMRAGKMQVFDRRREA